MLPIESFINLPSPPLGACMELNSQRALARFNRSALLNARPREQSVPVERSKRPKRGRFRERAGPLFAKRSPVAPQRIVRRLIRQ